MFLFLLIKCFLFYQQTLNNKYLRYFKSIVPSKCNARAFHNLYRLFYVFFLFFYVYLLFLFSYNQIKNFDFVKDAFKENAADFSQLVWEGSEVVGFASKKAGDTVYVVMYFNPAGNNESLSFYDNVHRVTGAGDVQQKSK